jgi:hypothetical protein
MPPSEADAFLLQESAFVESALAHLLVSMIADEMRGSGSTPIAGMAFLSSFGLFRASHFPRGCGISMHALW